MLNTTERREVKGCGLLRCHGCGAEFVPTREELDDHEHGVPVLCPACAKD